MLSSRRFNPRTFPFCVSTENRVAVFGFLGAFLIDFGSAFALNCMVLKRSKRIVGGQSMFLEIMDGGSIVRYFFLFLRGILLCYY